MSKQQPARIGKLRDTLVYEPLRRKSEQVAQLLFMQKLAGFANWSAYEMGEKLQAYIHVADEEYESALARYIEENKSDLETAAKAVPYKVPRTLRKTKAIKFPVPRKTLQQKIDAIYERVLIKTPDTARDRFARKYDLRELLPKKEYPFCTDAQIAEYTELKPQDIAYDVVIKMYKLPVSVRTLKRHLQKPYNVQLRLKTSAKRQASKLARSEM